MAEAAILDLGAAVAPASAPATAPESAGLRGKVRSINNSPAEYAAAANANRLPFRFIVLRSGSLDGIILPSAYPQTYPLSVSDASLSTHGLVSFTILFSSFLNIGAGESRWRIT